MLKSSARTVGAMALGELCQQLEQAGHAKDQPRCNALVAHPASDYDATYTAIRNHLDLALGFA